VVAGSVERATDSLLVKFDITDNAESMSVEYRGILPDLFREGQGIVAMGAFNGQNIFVADEVLAKHDENYMPPEVADALKAAEQQ
jgi:cytochrome c-type biogenesis protein CcmE